MVSYSGYESKGNRKVMIHVMIVPIKKKKMFCVSLCTWSCLLWNVIYDQCRIQLERFKLQIKNKTIFMQICKKGKKLGSFCCHGSGPQHPFSIISTLHNTHNTPITTALHHMHSQCKSQRLKIVVY